MITRPLRILMISKLRLILAFLIATALALPIAVHAQTENGEGPTETPPAETEEPVETPAETEEPTETPPGETEEPVETPVETEEPTETPPGETEEPVETPVETEEPVETPAETEEPTETPENGDEGRPDHAGPPDRAHPGRGISETVREHVDAWREAQADLREEVANALDNEEMTDEERSAIVNDFRDQLQALREEHLRSIPEAAQQLRREDRVGSEAGSADPRMREMREEMREFQAEVRERREQLRDELRDADASERRAILEDFRQESAERREEIREQRRRLVEELRDDRANRRGGDDGE